MAWLRRCSRFMHLASRALVMQKAGQQAGQNIGPGAQEQHCGPTSRRTPHPLRIVAHMVAPAHQGKSQSAQAPCALSSGTGCVTQGQMSQPLLQQKGPSSKKAAEGNVTPQNSFCELEQQQKAHFPSDMFGGKGRP